MRLKLCEILVYLKLCEILVYLKLLVKQENFKFLDCCKNKRNSAEILLNFKLYEILVNLKLFVKQENFKFSDCYRNKRNSAEILLNFHLVIYLIIMRYFQFSDDLAAIHSSCYGIIAYILCYWAGNMAHPGTPYLFRVSRVAPPTSCYASIWFTSSYS